MITDGQKTTPAPWVPFTRAGCDVGGVGTANIELENASTAATGDITKVFGSGSPEWNEARREPAARRRPTSSASRSTARRARRASAPATRTRSPTRCRTSPAATAASRRSSATKYVDPAITGGQRVRQGHRPATPITDPRGNCGFPGFDGMFAENTLGYVAQMQENGVPVTYGYISDAHDLHVPMLASDSYSSSATGPGELAHKQQLKAYDDAFAAFFDDLRAHGINETNTLFVVTVDEGDHFAGGIGAPAARRRLRHDLRPPHVHEPGGVPDEPDRRGQREHQGPAPGGRADLRHPLRRRADVLRQRPARPGPIRRCASSSATSATLTSLDPYVRDGAGVVQTVPLTDSSPTRSRRRRCTWSTPIRTGRRRSRCSATPTSSSRPRTRAPASTSLRRTPGFAWNHGDNQDEIGEHLGRHRRPGRRSQRRRRLDDVDRPHEPPADDPVARSACRTTTSRTATCSSQALDDRGHAARARTARRSTQLERAYEQLNAPFGAVRARHAAGLDEGARVHRRDEVQLDRGLDHVADRPAGRARRADPGRALNAAAFDGTPISDAARRTAGSARRTR